MALVLGFDIGTTSTIGILIELPDRVLAIASRPVTLSSPHPGHAEEDPDQWWRNVCAIAPELIATAGRPASDIAAIGVTGMLPTVVLIDADDRPIRPSIQQSDGRCGLEVQDILDQVDPGRFLAKAGNGVNQQLVGAKLRWIARHEPEIYARIDAVLGSYDYVNLRLTGRRTIEQNWALEAGVTEVASGRLSPELATLTGIPWSALPPRVGSSEIQGHVSEEAAVATGLKAGTPVVGGAADMVASALGAGVIHPGDVLLKFGGAVDVLTVARRASPSSQLYLDYHLVPGLFMPNGCMSTGGSALNWFVATFAAGLDTGGLSPHAALDRMAEKIPAGAEDLTVLPYFLGEKTPLHDPFARGVFDGITLSHTLGHFWRALLEAYGYALRHHVEVMTGLGYGPSRFLASDGGSASRVWMQIVADILGAPVQRMKNHPGSCLGAAWTAAVGAGLADWEGIGAFVATADRLEPRPQNRAVYDAGYARFRDLYVRLHSLHDEARA